jgi:hypothetical protein
MPTSASVYTIPTKYLVHNFQFPNHSCMFTKQYFPSICSFLDFKQGKQYESIKEYLLWRVSHSPLLSHGYMYYSNLCYRSNGKEIQWRLKYSKLTTVLWNHNMHTNNKIWGYLIAVQAGCTCRHSRHRLTPQFVIMHIFVIRIRVWC